jgi:hypothetical protein
MYGINRTSSGLEFSVLDGSLTTNHSIVLTDVRARAGYSFQILGFDEFGEKVQSEVVGYVGLTDSLVPPSQGQDGGFEIGGFEIRPSMLVLFVGLPLLVLLLAAFLLFQRMRSRIEG